MSKRADDAAFQAIRAAFLARREDFLQRIAADHSSQLKLEIQYHQETLPQYRQIFLGRVRAEPARRDELIRTFNKDTGGERLWLTDKGKRKEAIRIGKLSKNLFPKPERMSRKERQRQRKRQGKAREFDQLQKIMNHLKR